MDSALAAVLAFVLLGAMLVCVVIPRASGGARGVEGFEERRPKDPPSVLDPAPPKSGPITMPVEPKPQPGTMPVGRNPFQMVKDCLNGQDGMCAEINHIHYTGNYELSKSKMKKCTKKYPKDRTCHIAAITGSL